MILLFPTEDDKSTIKYLGKCIFENSLNKDIFNKYLDVIKRNKFDPFAYASDKEYAHLYVLDNFTGMSYSDIIKTKEWDHFIELVYNDPDFCGEYAECKDSDIPVGPLSKIDYDAYLKNGTLETVNELN